MPTACSPALTTVSSSKNYVNAIVASKHPSCQWLTMEQAVKHCTQGIGIWEWASNDCGEEPDVVMACCGDTPTLEIMAAVTILRDEMPELKDPCCQRSRPVQAGVRHTSIHMA